MSRFLRLISKVFSRLGKSNSPPTASPPNIPTTTTATSANPNNLSPPPSPSIPTIPSEEVVDAMTSEALTLARQRRIEILKAASKNWTASQLRQMLDHGVKTRGQKNWSGVVEGKSGVECRQAWTEYMSVKLRKALHNRPKKSE